MKTGSNVALPVESKALVESNGNPNITIVENGGLSAKQARGSSLKQVLASFVANIGPINTGLVFGFSAVALPQLESPDSSIQINEEQASLIASLSSATTPIGCILGGYLMDMLGRKRTLIITEIPLLLGWILISCASDVTLIYIGRLLVGLGSGMVGAPARVYTAEVTQPHLRGMLSALAGVAMSLGVLLEYALGSVLPWHIMAGINTIIPIAGLLLMSLMPESPNWLLSRSRNDEAKTALAKFRGRNFNVDKELNEMIAFREKNNVKRPENLKEIITALIHPSAMKPFLILFIYFAIYQFCGVNTITFYAVDIFRDSGTQMNKYLATVILGIVRFISTIAACIALRRCGRRPLTFISSVGCGLSMIGLGFYLYYKQQCLLNNEVPQQTWIPVACIFGFIIACTLGFLVVPWVMIGEVYPLQVRGIIGGFTTCSAHLFIFIVVKTYPFFLHTITNYGTFILYGCISLFGTIFFYIYLPETKGKSLQEIEDYFCGRNDSLKTGNFKSKHAPKLLEPNKKITMLP